VARGRGVVTQPGAQHPRGQRGAAGQVLARSRVQRGRGRVEPPRLEVEQRDAPARLGRNCACAGVGRHRLEQLDREAAPSLACRGLGGAPVAT
jgi:hypothetical protein